jgi:hypothetical protein
MKTMRDIFLIGVMLTFVTSLLTGLYFSIRASLYRRRPSQRWFVETNPLNALLFEDELLTEGLKYRAKAFRAFLVAFVSYAAGSFFVALFG